MSARAAGLLLAFGLAAATPVAQAAEFAEQVPLYRELRDWVVACDNQRSCQALSAAADWNYSEVRLSIQREAGPQGVLRLLLSHAGEDPVGGLWLDGADLGALLAPGAESGGVLLELEGEAARQLIARLRNGQRLQLDGDPALRGVSLSGLSAALLLMDAVQGRVGNRSALHRPGDEPVAQVPHPERPAPLRPFPAAPAMSEAKRAALGAAVVAATRAQWQDDTFEAPREVRVHPLTAEQALVVILLDCAAYNCEYALYRVGRQAPHAELPLRIEEPPLGHSGLSGTVAYDEASGQLAYLMKGRGLGDCGEAGHWQFDGEQFQLARLSALLRCSGGGFGGWPLLWRRD
jgi:hypothetical protein